MRGDQESLASSSLPRRVPTMNGSISISESRSGLGVLPAVRMFCGVLGAAVFVWGLMDGRLRDAEGALDGPFCLALAVAIGLCLVGATAHGRLRAYGRSAAWVATALVGQAVGLQLIEAGTNVSYQH